MTTTTAAVRPRATSGWSDRFAVWTGRLVTFAAVWSLIGILLRPLRFGAWVDDVFGLVNIPSAPSLFTVVLLFVLGNALSRRIRFAMWVVFAFQVLAVLVAAALAIFLVTGNTVHVDVDDYTTRISLALVFVDGVIGAVLAVLLLRARDAFPARLVRGSRIRALAVLVGGLIFSAMVCIALTEAFPVTYAPGWQRVIWPIRAAIGQLPDERTSAFGGRHGHHWIAALAGLLSAAALVGAAIVFLRSAHAKQFVSPQDELNVRRLVLESGERDSLGYFATRRDKSVVFSPDRKAAVTYRVVASVGLASADPIGAVTSWPAAIEAWTNEAHCFGWYPAVLSASEDGAAAYVRAGLKAIAIGDEAVIDVGTFTLAGPTMAPVRRSVERVRRAGYTVEVIRHADLSADELQRLSDTADAWRMGGDERGFSMALSRLGDPADGRCVAVLARDGAGELRGLLSFVPWGRHGLSLDLMRRDRESENGLTEFMVAELVTASPELGVRRISLNFAMFRGIFSASERVGAGPITRVTGAVLGVASKFWQLESLYRSNAKYLPSWVPRFMCLHPSANVTRVAIASGMAEGFLPARDPMTTRDPAATVRWDGRDDVPFAVAAREQADRLLAPARPTIRLTEQELVRRRKIGELETAGRPAYPVGVARTHSLTEVRTLGAGVPPDTRTGTHVSVAGRVRAIRNFGGLVFAVLQAEDVRLQVMLTDGATGCADVALWARTVDLGDLVSVTGEVVTSRYGELSVLASTWAMAAKCLRPVPSDRVGLTDPDARVRQRYLDLLLNRDARTLVEQRVRAVRALRDGLERRGFSEVETPMLQAVHGGANARPFITHINAYDADLYMRIAPELFLKRLAVAGMERIFELNRNFRNEGADATHNPEFTSLEAYLAWADYHSMRDLTRTLILEVASAVHGRPIARRPQADGTVEEVDLSVPWPTVTVHEAISRACEVELSPDTPCEKLRAVCEDRGVRIPATASAAAMVTELYDTLVEHQTVLPTFYIDFPIESSPLTRAHREDPRLSERWDLVAFGAEIGTAYSELIDPIDQRERLTTQSLLAAAGDPEAMQIDEAFLTALEYAMPPTGGLGIGVDRLVMMLTGTNIRSTLAFPFVRPEPGRR